MKNKKSIPKKILYYIKASRVDGWYVAIIFFLIGEWYAITDFPIKITLIGLISLIGIMSTGFWINYVYDRDIDKIAGKNLSFFDYISPKEMLVASFIVFIFCSFILYYFVNFLSFLIGLLTFLIGLVYSMPPFRLKSRPPFDVIANGLGFGFAFLLGWTVSGLKLDLTAYIGLIIISLAVCSHYLFYTCFDIETDKKCKVNTTCTKIGMNNSLSAGIIVFILALSISYYFLELTVLTLGFLICLPLLFSLKATKNIDYILFIIGGLFLTWSGSIGIILIIYSNSIFPIIITVITMFFLFYLIWSAKLYFTKTDEINKNV